jgi:uncharacterized RDD family membrane protein YckC
MQWYYAIGDQRHGPVEHAEFERLVSSGTVKSDTLVWRQGMANWQAYSAVAGTGVGTGGGVAGGAPVVDDGTEVCAVSGKRYPRREMINYEGKWISAEHRDEYFQRMREGVAQPGEGAVPGPFGYGGFWRRFLARVLDGMVQGVGGMMAVQGLMQLFFVAIGILYDVFFIRKYDATPGKMALGMKLLRTDGSKLSIGRIIGRHFAHIISGLPLAIGYIVAGFDDQKRTFHDRICDTRVVKTR